MTERLHTPWTHKLIASPLGMLLDTRLFEWIKDRSLPRVFRPARRALRGQSGDVRHGPRQGELMGFRPSTFFVIMKADILLQLFRPLLSC